MAKPKTRAGEFRAIHRNVRMSQRKAKLVADMIRGRSIDDARNILQFTKKRAAYLMDRVLKSAISNADQTGSVDVDRLYVSMATVDRARMLKRWRPGAQGRAKPELKRGCHILVAVSERAEAEADE
jgi:large subunit ribosomal protein L22